MLVKLEDDIISRINLKRIEVMRFKNILICASVLAVLSGCAEVPYTERQQLMIVSKEDENRIGEVTFEQIKEESPVNSDPRINSVMREAGGRIAKAAERPDYQWEFIVIAEDTVNAFALPGGKVAFYNGILPVCMDESGVAAVMGHEVAHVLARHGAERISQQRVLSLGGTLLSALIGKSVPAREAVLQAYGIGAKVGVILPYSRKHESEADKIGLILMAKAGYDPKAAVDFWKRMEEANKGGKPPVLLSTHPADEKRIEDLQEFLPIAMEYYTRAIAENPALNRPPKPLK